MKKIYFAGPLFNEAEKRFNLCITELLEKAGYAVFLPQRDGYEAAKLAGYSPAEVCKMIFSKDVSEIINCDIFFMVLDGCNPDPGACVELGIAFSNKKICYGIKTDVRAMELNLDLNPLIEGCFDKLFYNSNGEQLIKDLRSYFYEQLLS